MTFLFCSIYTLFTSFKKKVPALPHASSNFLSSFFASQMVFRVKCFANFQSFYNFSKNESPQNCLNSRGRGTSPYGTWLLQFSSSIHRFIEGIFNVFLLRMHKVYYTEIQDPVSLGSCWSQKYFKICKYSMQSHSALNKIAIFVFHLI